MAAKIYLENSELHIETESVAKIISLTEDGQFLQTRLTNRETGAEAVYGKLPSDEFQILFNDEKLCGSTPGWAFGELKTETMAQGELHGWFQLIRPHLTVERHYVAYPETSFIQEWTVYKNTGDNAVINTPSIFTQRLTPGKIEQVDYAYMTGGANFTGSTMFKTVALFDGYTKDFDSNGEPEMSEVDGLYEDKRHPRFNGSGIWFQFMAMRNRETGEGWVLHFDYQGWWTANYTCRDGITSAIGRCMLKNYAFPADSVLETPKVAIGVFRGDWDDLGNMNNDYIYRYKWDYTRDRYFNRTNFTIWRAAPLTDKVFRMVEMARQIGSERIWVDDFWFDAKGNYNGVFGDDWRHINQYINRHGMLFRLWMPPWHADRLSQVWLEHPEWMIDFHGNWYNWTIDMSYEEAYQWVLGMLKNKQQEFGTYDLRVDGDPCNLRNDGSHDMEDGDWNGSFLQSQNFYRLYKEFKDQNPNAGIDGCSSGGHTISIESVRYVDQQQITDGECKHMGGYWTTLLMPIDKHQGMPISGRRRRSFTEYNEAHQSLFSAPGVQHQNPLDPYTQSALDGMRKEHELFYWLRAQGVYGRWVQVFRPTLEHGDPTYLLQRMTKDRIKGMIMISTWNTNKMLGKSERVFPKGLIAGADYRIESLRGSIAAQTKSGAEWMRDGIALTNVQPGEYLLINLPNRPGHGDGTAPKPETPKGLTKNAETWLRRDGIALSWQPVHDNGRMIHYEVNKNGEFFNNIAIGSFMFDQDGKQSDEYAVCTADSDGNKSEYVIAK